ncbi:related to PHO36 - regulatory role in lipid and phosphate metabolism [Fusarium torulosum]|uniref:Related to PHO36 - regulatory role in lipid and phosphate metabolism n=1 Tax=Fusarium torulosum TaxID=33205 RepID=A0AAE8M2L5_9HYPO|nr:related to PHO36 - regulatory role in lipid and phosphate metabolism [Fusarium torulosum]
MADTKLNGARNRRPSATDNLIDTAKRIESKVENSLLLLWDDLPDWRRDNAFILSGYRQSQNSYTHSFRSLFYMHNESVNIWSHLLGAIVFIASAAYVDRVVRPRYASASSTDVLVFACFFGGAVVCLGMSATFHTLLNHSATVAKWGNKLDYTGIVALIVGSYVPALYYGFFCLPNLMTAYLWVICVLGTGCGLVSWIERFRTPTWRPYRTAMFIGLGVSGVVPVIHGACIYGLQGLEERMSLSWVVLHGAMYIFGAVLYAVRWPERSAPGSFDIWGNSHQIFHVFVILAAVTHFYGMAKAFDYHHTIMGSQCLMD